MVDNNFCRATTGLLVSVRSVDEAIVALAGGADVIDVKEPARGPLGAAEPRVIAEVVRAVDGRAPVTAALGELLDFEIETPYSPDVEHVAPSSHDIQLLTPSPPDSRNLLAPSPPPGRVEEGPAAPPNRNLDATSSLVLPAGVSLAKLGLRGCRDIDDWQRALNNAASALRGKLANRIDLVAVIYADWQSAGAPPPTDVMRLAIASSSPALLIDTCDKSAGNLFDHLHTNEIAGIIWHARENRIATVLAGSLSDASFERAIRLAPDLVAVRGAVCNSGRNGTVELRRVKHLKQQLARAANRSIASSNS